ncbi:hypothetical protein [Herbaspirillum sp. RV1423]|uniref:hypothetical protein n=1 Tax=Herbaspirillum sp. RV1423 TaxID=1443993 RepID=UPI00055768FA|nr:hypothetical protein [Herbaspirillum sp. RV1423]
MATHSTVHRYTIPIHSARPKGAPRYEFYAPKIGRRVTLFTPLQVRFWTLLESAPLVHSYCERPAYWEAVEGRRLTDFWVKAGPREACCILADDVRPGRVGTLSSSLDIGVRYVAAGSLASRSVWIDNWVRILPYLTLNARLVNERLVRDIERASVAAPTLAQLECDFQPNDIVLVRTAVFMLLHRGSIKADALRLLPLGPGTVFRRALV